MSFAAFHPLRNGASVTVLATLLAACSQPVPAQQVDAAGRTSQHHAYRVATVVTGLEHPWSLAILPNGDMLVTERPGRLRMVRNGELVAEPISGLPEIGAGGQGGLLDVVLHPDFATNRLVYLSYSKPGPDRTRTTAVIRGQLDGMRLTNVEEVFEANAFTDRGQHFGSRIVFDGNGYMFVSVGDRGIMEQAQNLANHQGGVHRLHEDGRVPADNPFVNTAGALPEIWSYGNRNIQGMARHPQTGELWAVEHGPRGGDELNRIQPGRNYGWPTITYGINYNGTPITDITEREGMEQPVNYWVPSIATSGLTIYSGDRFPSWRGDIFIGGLAGQQIARVRVGPNGDVVEKEVLLEGVGRVRDIRTGADGYIYVLFDNESAALVRLEPAS